MITEDYLFKRIHRPEGVYQYNKKNKEYTFWIRNDETHLMIASRRISEYKFRKAIREERKEWKKYIEDCLK